MFETLFGVEMPAALRFFIAFLVVLGLIGATAWFVRRYGAERFGGSAARGRQPRLAVIDAAAVDGRRRLVLIRRDNVEHLLIIGGPTDVVVEQNIVRAAGSTRDLPRETTVSRPTAMADTLTRPVPLGEGSLWPLQPQPEIVARPPRAPIPEEPAQWTAQPEAPARPSRPADTLTGLADELSSRPRDFSSPPAARTAPPPITATPPMMPPAEQPQAAGTDQNLAEMAQRLEAALRSPNETRRGADTPIKTEAKAAPMSEPKPPRVEAKPAQPKTLYDSLEQEMASLLGRPSGKT
jgi:flagellar biogenesis protein FliO